MRMRTRAPHLSAKGGLRTLTQSLTAGLGQYGITAIAALRRVHYLSITGVPLLLDTIGNVRGKRLTTPPGNLRVGFAHCCSLMVGGKSERRSEVGIVEEAHRRVAREWSRA